MATLACLQSRGESGTGAARPCAALRRAASVQDDAGLFLKSCRPTQRPRPSLPQDFSSEPTARAAGSPPTPLHTPGPLRALHTLPSASG